MRKWKRTNRKKMWYRLVSKDGYIDMLFTSYTMLQEYWRRLPLSKSLECHWEVFEA